MNFIQIITRPLFVYTTVNDRTHTAYQSIVVDFKLALKIQ